MFYRCVTFSNQHHLAWQLIVNRDYTSRVPYTSLTSCHSEIVWILHSYAYGIRAYVREYVYLWREHGARQRRRERWVGRGSKRYKRGKGNERDYLHGVTGDYVCLSTKPPSAFVLFYLFLRSRRLSVAA